MKKELEEVYFNIALDIARAEREQIQETAVPQPARLLDDCLSPSRARAVALSSQPTQFESAHLSGCRICARLVHNFKQTIPSERTPAVRRLLNSLKRYGQTAERITREWIEVAQENARIFSHGIGEWAFDSGNVPAIARRFEADGLSVQLDLREQTGQFVVEVASSDEALCGRTLTIILLGGTGGELCVPVQLSGRRPGVCYGSAAADERADAVLQNLGPVILPVIAPADGPRAL